MAGDDQVEAAYILPHCGAGFRFKRAQGLRCLPQGPRPPGSQILAFASGKVGEQEGVGCSFKDGKKSSA